MFEPVLPTSIASSEFRTLLETDAVTVGIIGQGIVGQMSARLATRTGWRVIGCDRDRERVSALEREAANYPNWQLTTDVTSLERADVLIIAVRIPVSPDGVADEQSLRDVCRDLRRLRPRNRLILLETTVPPGTTRRLSRELQESLSGGRTYFAHCPERLRVGDSPENVLEIPRLVGGIDPAAADLACRYLDRVGYRPIRVSCPEVAELSKLLENAFLTTGITLMSEITQVAHALGINATEVAAAASTKTTGYYAFRPGPAIGGHCLGNDLGLLRATAQRLDVTTPVLDGVAATAGRMTASTLGCLKALLARRGLATGGSTFWIIGVGFKAGSSDTTASPAIELVRELRKEGAEVLYSDPVVAHFEVDGRLVRRVPANSREDRVVAAMILSGDPAIDLDELAKHVPLVLDLGGGRVMRDTKSVEICTL